MNCIAVVRNSASGRGRTAAAWDAFREECDAIGLPIHHVATTAPGSAEGQARELAGEFSVVAAAGGDGTLSEVANGLLGTKASLGLVPLGTGNDFARALGIGTDVRLAAQTLAYGDPFDCDVCRWTLADGTTRIALNVCGSGFDARVADRINRGIRGLAGTPAYLAAVFLELMSHRPAQFEVLADGVPQSAQAMLCSIANSQSYGGGMKVAPKASLEDGLLDLVLVRAVGKFRFLTQFPKVFSGAHLDLPEVHFQTVRQVRISSEPPTPVLADGEVVGMTPVVYQVVPKALSVLRPATSA